MKQLRLLRVQIAAAALAAVVVATAWLLAGCYVKSVEDAILKTFADRVGPADSCVVKVLRTTDDDVARGVLHEVVVEGKGVHPAAAPVIDHFRVRVEEAVFDVGKRTFKGARRAEISMDLRDQDVVSYIRSLRPEMKTLRMLVVNNDHVVFFVDALKMRFVGSIVVNGLQIEFQLKEAMEGGAPMDPDEASLIVDEINPIVDLAAWPLTVSTVRLSLTPGRIALNAGIDSFDAGAFTGKGGTVSAPPETMTNERDEQVLIVIPSGKATIGRDGGPSEEGPAHSVGLQSFYLGKCEVTNAQFARFVAATRYETTAEREGSSAVWSGTAWQQLAGASWQHPGGSGTSADPEHPVVHVSRQDAEAYCAWAGLRLPSEQEWEYAARGREARAWPWGPKYESSCCQSSVGQPAPAGGTAAVGRYTNGAAPFGSLDMAGNVWEWTASSCQRYPGNRDQKYYNDASFIIRGGSWAVTDPEKLRTTARSFGAPTLHSQQLGFRCARSR